MNTGPRVTAKLGLILLCSGLSLCGHGSPSIENLSLSDGSISEPRQLGTQIPSKTQPADVTNIEVRADALPVPGELDKSFNPQVGLNWCTHCPEAINVDVAHGLLVQPDGKILVGGRGLLRLNQDGQLDPSFNSGVLNPGVSLRPLVTDMALQPDGRILICGLFTQVHDKPRRGIARLHPDGQLDESFDPGLHIVGGDVRSIAWRTDSRVVIAGTITTVHGVARRGVALLHEDGSLDSDFNPGLGANIAAVNSVRISRSGSLNLAGGFTSFNGVSRHGLVRLFPDGSVDSNFNPALSADLSDRRINSSGPPRLLEVQSDEKIWVTGDFGKATDGTGGITNLVRFKPDGNVDLALAIGSSQAPEYSPLAFALQPDGKFLVSAHRFPIMRFNPDGTRDPSFLDQAFALPGYDPEFVELQTDGRILMAGVTQGSNLMRLYGNDLPFFPPSYESDSLRYSRDIGIVFLMTAYPGSKVVIEATSSLKRSDWTPIQTNWMGNLRVERYNKVIIEDTNATSLLRRFYRLVSP